VHTSLYLQLRKLLDEMQESLEHEIEMIRLGKNPRKLSPPRKSK